jgi:hypothetical protein
VCAQQGGKHDVAACGGRLESGIAVDLQNAAESFEVQRDRGVPPELVRAAYRIHAYLTTQQN